MTDRRTTSDHPKPAQHSRCGARKITLRLYFFPGLLKTQVHNIVLTYFKKKKKKKTRVPYGIKIRKRCFCFMFF